MYKYQNYILKLNKNNINYKYTINSINELIEKQEIIEKGKKGIIPSNKEKEIYLKYLLKNNSLRQYFINLRDDIIKSTNFIPKEYKITSLKKLYTIYY